MGSYFLVFCIFDIVDSYFFLYFVFLSNCIRIVFVFVCIFSYFFCKNTKYEKNTNNIQKKIHFVFLYFFCIFPLRPKMQFVFLFFLYFSSPSQIALCPFVFLRSLDMPSKNKTANPSMYVVFSVC